MPYAVAKGAGAKHVLLTTGPQFGNGQKFHEVDVVTAECVLGMSVFRDVLADLRDVVGGRSATTQNALRDLRKTCLSELTDIYPRILRQHLQKMQRMPYS